MGSEGDIANPGEPAVNRPTFVMGNQPHEEAQLFQMLEGQKKLILGGNHHKLTLLNIPSKVLMPNVIKEFSKDTDVQGPL
jgi:hypothetical protein